MCDVNLTQKRKYMKMMLKGPARGYFTRHVRHAKTYEDPAHRPKKRYNNHEELYRQFHELKEMPLTRTMSDEPMASEIEVLQAFVPFAMAIQGQITTGNQGDRYLPDQLQETFAIRQFKIVWTIGREGPPET